MGTNKKKATVWAIKASALVVSSFLAFNVSAQRSPEPSAEIELQTNFNRIDGVRLGSSSGCTASQRFDLSRNPAGCVGEYLLGSRNASGSCPSGQTGTITTTYYDYGWLNVVGRGRVVNRTTTSTSNTCKVTTPPTPPTPPPTSPAPGTVMNVSISNELICGLGSSNYYSGGAGNTIKNNIISAYRSLNSLGRCPELAGYNYWQSSYLGQDKQVWSKTLERIQSSNTPAAIADSIRIANGLCSSAAKNYVGKYDKNYVSAVYRNGSGNGCRLTY